MVTNNFFYKNTSKSPTDKILILHHKALCFALHFCRPCGLKNVQLINGNIVRVDIESVSNYLSKRFMV